ncbi:MAG: T9SS type A sorting domain-containing protein [Chitinophagales bacterium]|nr:T9SS type A sorting domain-containing protein [Chitinophagales bacterium]
MKNIFFSLVFFVFMHFFGATASYAQPAILWQTTVGDSLIENPNAICLASDGGFYFAGSTSPKLNDTCANVYDNADVWVVRFDKHKNFLWKMCYGGSLGDAAYGIAATLDGGCIIGADTYSNDGDVSGNHGDRDFWIFKLDSNGVIHWQKCYGGSSTEYLNGITATIDGGFLVFGLSYSSDGDVPFNYSPWYYNDGWVIKIDSQGAIQWNRVLGGTNFDQVIDGIETTKGKYLLSCNTSSTDYDLENFTIGGSDVWLLMLDSNGNTIWSKTFYGPATETGADLAQCANGDFLIACKTYSYLFETNSTGYHGGGDGLVFRVDSAGNFIWVKVLGGTSEDNFRPIHELPDGSIMVTGNTNSHDGDVSTPYANINIWNVKLDASGNLLSSLVVGGNDYDAIQSSILYDQNNILFAAETESKDGDILSHPGNAPNDDWDAWVVEIGDYNTVNEIHVPAFTLFAKPNPFTLETILRIEGAEQGKSYHAVLLNTLGVTCRRIMINSNSDYKLMREELPGGIYFLKIFDSDNLQLKTIKLVIV